MFARSSGDSASQRAAAAPARLSGFASATLEPSFSKALPISPARLASTASFRALIALSHDLVHDGGLHAGGLELGEGLSGIDRVELFGIAHQHHAGDTERIRDPEQVAGLDGGGERALVDHQRGLPERGTHVARTLLRHAPLGNAGVAREEALEGLAPDPGLALQRPRRRGRGREAPDPVALLLHERAGAPQHGRLARAGIALDTPTVRSFADRMSLTASFCPWVRGPFLSALSTARPRIGAAPRP